MTKSISDQIQAGLDARTSMDLPLGAGIALSRAYRRMLGVDGTSVEDAARAAFTPTGPSIRELEAGIRARRRSAGLEAA